MEWTVTLEMTSRMGLMDGFIAGDGIEWNEMVGLLRMRHEPILRIGGVY